MPCSRTQHGLTRVGLEPRPLDPESEALTTRPPRSPLPFIVSSLKDIEGLIEVMRFQSLLVYNCCLSNGYKEKHTNAYTFRFW